MTDDEVKEIQRHNQTKATVRFFFFTQNYQHGCFSSGAITHHARRFLPIKLERSGYVNVCKMEPITDYSVTQTKQ